MLSLNAFLYEHQSEGRLKVEKESSTVKYPE